MDFFVERAATLEEAQAALRRKYGDRARVLGRKTYTYGGVFGLFQKQGVELTGYYSHAPAYQPRHYGGNEEHARLVQQAVAATAAKSQRAYQAPEPGAAAPNSGAGGNGGAVNNNGGGNNATGSVSEADRSLQQVLDELRHLRQSVGQAGVARPPAGIVELRELLAANECSARFVKRLEDQLGDTMSLSALEDPDQVRVAALAAIVAAIDIHSWERKSTTPRVVSLVGPTGVGKTTTIAKLAAMYGAVANERQDVRVLTIDSYRIGAFYQLQKYGEIMRIPVSGVDGVEEMHTQLSLAADADWVFIDTVGKSPHDLAKLAEVNELVRAANGEVHLVVSATTKATDLLEVFRQFEPFGYDSVIVTKLDETNTVGGIVSALSEKQKSVSFVTDGQNVPQDISRARVESFVRHLRGFRPTDIDTIAGSSLTNAAQGER